MKEEGIAMEKVIVTHDDTNLNYSSVKVVNEHLEKGWTVKHVEMCATQHEITAIFVLEKPDKTNTTPTV